MDNAMVKRGVGAIVLAVIAAVLLGYLLKDKSQERQDVVEMKLPGAPELNIPSLTSNLTGSSDSIIPTLEGSVDSIKNVGTGIVASATGAMNKVTETTKVTMDSTSAAIQGAKPGFAIRPASQNAEKEIIEKTAQATSAATPKIEKTANTAKETVIASASSATKKAFKPRIVEKKKPAKPAKKSEPKQAKAAAKPASKPAKTSTAAAPAGKYSIQLLATSSQSRANKLASTMKGEGYKAFITQTTRSDKVLYRVRVGGHGDRTSAITAQESMKRRYQKNFFVQNSLVVSN
ncbi:MAG: SPOR domain-containing protein [Cocleimonas sp.]